MRLIESLCRMFVLIIVGIVFCWSVSWAQSGAAQVTYKPTGATTNVSVQAALRTNTILPQSFGAKGDGVTDDGPAFARAVAAANPGDTIVVSSATNSGFVIATGFTVNKSLTFSSGTPSSPAQFLAGANNITMITVAASGGLGEVKFDGINFNANGHTGSFPSNPLVAVSLAGTSGSPLNNMTFTDNVWNGAFTYAVNCTFSFFNVFDGNRVFGAAMTGFNLSNQCNSVSGHGNSFYGINSGITNAILFNNSQVLQLAGTTLECGASFVTFNSYGVELDGGDAENAVGCSSMTGASAASFINVGAGFAGAPVFGFKLSGWNLASSSYGVTVGYASGVDISASTCQVTVLCVAVVSSPSAVSTYALNNNITLSGMDYGTLTPAQHIGLIGSGNNNTTASNLSTEYINPMKFVYGTPTPQNAHVPNLGDNIFYWGDVTGGNDGPTPVSSATNASPVVFTLTTAAPITGSSVSISGFTSGWTGANGTFTATATGSDTFSIPVNSTSFGAVSGTPVVVFLSPDLGGNFQAIYNNGTAVVPSARFLDPLFIVGSNTMSTNVIGSMLHIPYNSNMTNGIVDAYKNAGGNTFVGADNYLGTESGHPYASVIYNDGLQDTVIKSGTNALVLTPTAEQILNVPTGAGSGGLYLCIDSTGQIYKKATCP